MKQIIRIQFNRLKDLKILSSGSQAIGWVLSLLISCYFLILMAISLYETSSHKGIVFATDNDGGRAIEVSMQTRWYNSNHFAPYGNLYYRLSHTLADLVPLNSSKLSPLENKERSHHFVLKLVSLFSLFGLGIFIGWLLFGISFPVPLFGTLLTVTATKISMWSEWLFRPHPEHLLNLTIAVALYYFAKLLKNRDDQRTFILSALFWGLAMAVKRSTSMFIPGILIFMLFPIGKENLKKTVHYIGYMLLAYLLIGFPQNFGFYKHIKFLMYESSLHSIGDWGSISTNFILTWNQIAYLIPVIALAVFFSSNKEKNFSVKFIVFVLLSFIPILARKLSFASDHHTMPMAISCMILALVATIQYLPWRLNSPWVSTIIILIFLKCLGVSDSYKAMQKNISRCESELAELNEIVAKRVSPNALFAKEPFFPSNEKINHFTTSHWGIDWNLISDKTKIIGLTRSSLNNHLSTPPPSFYGKMIERWDDKRIFYNQLHDQTKVLSPQGIEFKKVFSGKECDHELWMATSLEGI